MLASNMLGPDVTLELDLQPVPLILGDTGRIVQVRGPGSSFTQPLCCAWFSRSPAGTLHGRPAGCGWR